MSPQALLLPAGGLDLLRPRQARGFTVQDPASMLAVHLLDPRPGHRCLDLCAAPGGKTGHLAELLGGQGAVLAVDVKERRLEQVQAAVRRLHLGGVATLAADAREPLPGVTPESFDRVLVDAPCTALGTAGRHPEVRWRREPGDPARLAELQGALLARGAAYVKPGGRLLYAVCTLTRAEAVEVPAAFAAAHPGWRPVSPGHLGPAAARARERGERLAPEVPGLLLTLPQDRAEAFALVAWDRLPADTRA